MGIKLGSTDIAATYLGSTDVSSLMLGAGEVWTGALLNIDFTSGALPNSVTFARNAASMRWTSGQTVEFVPANTPRFEHDPDTGAATGLRIEGSHQSAVRNPVASGVTAGVLGSGGALPTNWTNSGSTSLGATYQILGTRVVQGVTCLEIRLSGTASATGSLIISAEGGSANPAVAAQGQTWTATGFIGVSAGSTTGVGNVKMGINERNSTGTLLAQNGLALNKATLDAKYVGRYSYRRTLSNASTGTVSPALIVDLTSGNAFDITLLFGLPQIQQTAGLPGTPTQDGTSVPAEVCTASLPSALSSGSLEVSGTAPKGGIASVLAQLDDGTAANRITVRRDTAGTTWATFVVSSATVADLNLGLWMDDVPATVALSWDGTQCSACLGGRTVQTSAVAGPSGLTTARIGADLSGNYWGGVVKKLAAYNKTARPLATRSAPAWVHDDFHRADGLPVAPPNSAGLVYQQVQPIADPTAVVVAQISGNKLVTADSSSTTQTASYTGSDLGAAPHRVACRGFFQSGTTNRGDFALISNAYGLDAVAQVTGTSGDAASGSVHIVFTDTVCQVGVFEAGTLTVLANVTYGTTCVTDGATPYRFGWRVLPNDFYAIELPDGSDYVIYAPRLTARKGRYVTFESFWQKPNPLPTVFTEVYAA